MSYIVNGTKVKKVGVLIEPSTYDADIEPVDMQHGKTAYVKGKKIVGTGKAFEFATYSRVKMRQIEDTNGNSRYGFKLKVGQGANILFLVNTTIGDILRQTEYITEIKDNSYVKIGINDTTSGEVYAFHSGEYVYIFCTEVSNNETESIIFIGKDNEL